MTDGRTDGRSEQKRDIHTNGKLISRKGWLVSSYESLARTGKVSQVFSVLWLARERGGQSNMWL